MFVESKFHLLAVSYGENYFSFVVNMLKIKAIIMTSNSCLVCNKLLAIK